MLRNDAVPRIEVNPETNLDRAGPRVPEPAESSLLSLPQAIASAPRRASALRTRLRSILRTQYESESMTSSVDRCSPQVFDGAGHGPGHR
jgi:hypothetical protein